MMKSKRLRFVAALLSVIVIQHGTRTLSLAGRAVGHSRAEPILSEGKERSTQLRQIRQGEITNLRVTHPSFANNIFLFFAQRLSICAPEMI